MKLDINETGSYDADKRALCLRAIILLDGKEIAKCTAADEEAGEVTRYIPRDDPRWQTEFILASYWPTETLRGVVKIVDPEAES